MLGAILTVTFHAAMPDIQGFESECDPEASAARVAEGGEWIAVRGAQLRDHEPMHDVATGTTLIVPGCGHQDAGLALRVRGDHRDFDRDHDHLVLAGHGVTGAMTTLNVTKDDGTNGTLQVLDGTFEARSTVPHIALHAAGLLALAAGAGLLRPAHPRAARSIPLGAAAGIAFALLGLRAGLGLVLFLLVAPIMAFVALAGLVGSITERHRKWWFWAALLAFALAWWSTFVPFLNAFPLTPEA